ncbi:MAG: NfeD family protein [Pseudomonadota bacterium]
MEQVLTMFGDPAWTWLALGLVLLILELATGTLFLLGPGAAALLVAAAAALFGMSTTTQLVVFAVVAVALTVAGRSKAVRDALQGPGDRPLLNRKAEQLVGRRVVASEPFEGGEGAVRLNDTRYLARLADGRTDAVAEGAALEIRAVEGVTLVVSPPQ